VEDRLAVQPRVDLLVRSILLLVVGVVSFLAIVYVAGMVTHRPSRAVQSAGMLPHGGAAPVRSLQSAKLPADHTREAARTRAPSAAEFAAKLAGTTNAYAREHGTHQQVGGVHCVQASPGHYMCSYAVTRPGAQPQCHLVQVRWTPGRASSFDITLSGRTQRCGTLKDAIRSLG